MTSSQYIRCLPGGLDNKDGLLQTSRHSTTASSIRPSASRTFSQRRFKERGLALQPRPRSYPSLEVLWGWASQAEERITPSSMYFSRLSAQCAYEQTRSRWTSSQPASRLRCRCIWRRKVVGSVASSTLPAGPAGPSSACRRPGQTET